MPTKPPINAIAAAFFAAAGIEPPTLFAATDIGPAAASRSPENFEVHLPANLRVKEVLKVLGISRTTLYRAWSEGWGPEYFLVGNSRRVPLQVAITWRGKGEHADGGQGL